MGHVVVGTAGHIDHGKSSLVRALTGTDPDRLPEEKRRQITIDLGFAFLDDVAAIIDVPGHEKFIHHMVAGAGTIDFALLVVAADDGIMPQTREHLHILRLLGVQRGAIVLTKCEVAEDEWRELVKDQIRSSVRGTFLESATIFEVDSLSGLGIAELRAFLLSELPRIPARDSHRVLRIPLDRVFSIHGHGTVVTGTVVSGAVDKDSRVVLLPGKTPARVKQLQSNARDYTALEAGMRAALNLAVDDVPQRGQTVCGADTLLTARRISVRVDGIPDAPAMKDRQRVRLLIGTHEVMGRYRLLSREEGFDLALLLLDEEVVAAFSDHFILRRYSPVDTLGGGVVLDVEPPLRGARNRQETLAAYRLLATVAEDQNPVVLWVKLRAPFGVELAYVAKLFALPLDLAHGLFASEEWLVCHGLVAHKERLAGWQEALLAVIATLHKEQPASAGFTVLQISARMAALKPALLDYALTSLVRIGKAVEENGTFKLPGRSQAVDAKLNALMETVVSQLTEADFAPPSAGALAELLKSPRTEIEKALVHAHKTGRAMRLGTDLFFEKAAFDRAIAVVRQMLSARGNVQVSDLSKSLNSSRKYVVPFLEYLDSIGLTERRENIRVPGRNINSQP
ncbi:MAG: selenocysteine-specific translation elongation factor [bacterium]|nr:selenocysteine-specific translation elongation factor [bacterium]